MSMATNAGFLDSVPIGCGMDWFTDTAPDNWLFCRGQAISRTDYAELFAVIGTTFGIGDGSTTFNLPDFSGKTGVGKNNDTFDELGKEVGTETNTLNKNQIPTLSFNGLTSVTPASKGNFDYSETPQSFTRDAIRTLNNNRGTIEITNNDQKTVNNIQPSLVINKIIKVK